MAASNTTTETHRITLDLAEWDNFSLSPSQETAVRSFRSRYRFTMSRKSSVMAGHVIDQWWIPQPGLYGERNADSPNRTESINCWWAMCRGHGSAADDKEVQESYILATLLPQARSNASRRVFADASLLPSRCTGAQTFRDLEAMLKQAYEEERDVCDFFRQSARVLGPPDYDHRIANIYREFSAELLDDACSALRNKGDRGLRISLARWKQKMNAIGRRRGNVAEKTVLDILSYECRAAFHRAYSAVWLLLIEKLSHDYGWNETTRLFHRLWHVDQVMPPSPVSESFHLFHGHVFGLHPAGGDFIMTPTGSRLIGELIVKPDDQKRHLRFLNGFLIAVYAYANRYNFAKELRRGPPMSSTDDIDLSNELPRRPHRASRRRTR